MNAPFQVPDVPEEWTAIITTFIRDHVAAARAKGLTLGLSGGLDSAVVAALAVRALGPDAVVPVILPAATSNPQDAEHANLMAKHLGLKARTHSIAAIDEAVTATVGPLAAGAGANVKARSRMMILYAIAQQEGLLVCGTGNKSEILTGYFTKFGDGGNDLQPIGDLYKTQVRDLAAWLDVPSAIIAKPPSAGLWDGQTDEEEMGVTYHDLDRVLKGMELGSSPDQIAHRTGIEADIVSRVEAMVRRSEHKRHPALIPKLAARTVGIDWRRSVHWHA